MEIGHDTREQMLWNPGQSSEAKEGIAVSGPGQYLPDPTAGITNPGALPQAKIVRRRRNFKPLPCPQCGTACFRNRTRTRVLHDVGDLVTGNPRDIELVYWQHRCTKCNKFFDADTSDYSLLKARYTHRVVSLAGTPRRGGRLALPSGQLAFVA
jgi:hypothetical protein